MRIAYLQADEVKGGMFSRENMIIVRDYQGEKLSGFFDKGSIKEGRLEVVVLETKEDWAWVKPNGGFFFERDSGIPVRVESLKY